MIFKGISLTLYNDKLQSTLSDISIMLQSSLDNLDCTEPSALQLTHAISYKRMYLLSVDLTPLINSLESIYSVAMKTHALTNVCDSLIKSIEELKNFPQEEQHPFGDSKMTNHIDKVTYVIPDELEFLFDEGMYWLLKTNDNYITKHDFEELFKPKPRRTIEEINENNDEIADLGSICYLAWPNMYYTGSPWYEQHVWMWFIPDITIIVPSNVIPSKFQPVLWCSSRFSPENSVWSSEMNIQLNKKLLTSNKFQDSPNNLIENESDSLGKYTPFTSSPGKESLEIIAQGETITENVNECFIWYPEERVLEACTIIRPSSFNNKVNVLVFSKLDLLKYVEGWHNPLDNESKIWKNACRLLYEKNINENLQIKSNISKLNRIANDKQVRMQTIRENKLLYNDLQKLSNYDFDSTFPKMELAINFIRRWHGYQSVAGKSELGPIAAWLVTQKHSESSEYNDTPLKNYYGTISIKRNE